MIGLVAKLKSLDRINPYILMVIFFLTSLFLLYFQHGPYTAQRSTFPLSDIRLDNMEAKCLKMIDEGIIYQPGEMGCHHGIFFYAFLYNLSNLFPQNLNFSILYLSLLIYTLSFFFLYKILKKEVGTYYFLSLFMYLILGFIYSLKEFSPAYLLGFFLFFWGFYLLFYSDFPLKSLFSGFLFVLAIFTIQLLLIYLAIIFLFFIIKIFEIKVKNKRINFNFKHILQFSFFLLPFVLIPILLSILFPTLFFNFIDYNLHIGSISLQSGEVSRGILGVFSEGFSHIIPNLFKLVMIQDHIIIFIFIISLYLSLKRKDFLNLFSLAIILASLIFLVRFSVIFYRMILFIIPLFIIIFLKLLKDSKNNKIIRNTLFFIFILLIYPGFKIIFLTNQMYHLEQDVGSILHNFPKQERILADTDRLRFYDYSENYSMDTLPRNAFFQYDVTEANNLENAGWINLTLWKQREQKIELYFHNMIMKDILNRRYSAIMFLPGGIGFNINKLLGRLAYSLEKENNVTSFSVVYPMQCEFFIPTMEERCPDCSNKIFTLFINESDCKEMKKIMREYYTPDLLNKICRKDRFAWNSIMDAAKINNVLLEATPCSQGGHLIEHYDKRYNINGYDIFIIIIIFILILSIPVLDNLTKKEHLS